MSSLDRAKQRWGSAGVEQGGGKGAGPVDLSPWRQYSISPADEARTGIAHLHFFAFQRVASEERCVLVVRTGKVACLKWIKKDYPAKPASVWKIKNSPVTGFVTCSHQHPKFSYMEQVQHAWQAGYYVLEEEQKSPDVGRGEFHMPGSLCSTRDATPEYSRSARPLNGFEQDASLRARRGGDVLGERFLRGEYQPGEVIDPHCLLPLTGDYDLMGAFPVDNPGGMNLVLVHGQGDDPRKLEQVAPDVLLRKMRENPYTDRIAERLNEAFGGRDRVMHGPHDLKFDPHENNDDGCAVFAPDLAFFLPNVDAVVDFYRRIGRLSSLPRPERDLRR